MCLQDDRDLVQASWFEPLFQAFCSYYRKTHNTDDDESSEYKLRFLKVEQTIHLITGITATQDISAYLQLLEETCHTETIYEVIKLLMSRKKEYIQAENDHTYACFIHFLLPYVELISEMGLSFKKITKSSQPDIISSFYKFSKKLDSMLQRKGLPSQIKDTKSALKGLKNLKKAYLGRQNSKDGEFYETLGLIALLIQLLNAYSTKDTTLMKICLICVINQGTYLILSLLFQP